MTSMQVVTALSTLAVVATVFATKNKKWGRKRSLTLKYFNIGGPAEAIRLTFTIGGIAFIDERLSPEEFQKIKPGLPFGQVPILEIDGVVLPQSVAILRFAGREAGLYPVNDPVAAAQCDAVIDGLTDIQAKLRPSLYEQDPEKKAVLRKELNDTILPASLAQFQRLLLASGKGDWFVGDRMSIADIAVSTRLKWFRSGVLDGIEVGVCDAFPALVALQERVFSHPKVAAYYAVKAN